MDERNANSSQPEDSLDRPRDDGLAKDPSTTNAALNIVIAGAEAGDGGPAVVESAELQDKTVISQRPIATAEAFYHPVVVAELAKVLVGKQLDHFFLDELVGGGGMGAVFRGRDNRLDRTVAVKVIPSARCDAETLRRFRVEAQSAAKLDHPNIARVYYVGESGSWHYIVFEFIEGVNLKDLVVQRGPLSVDDSVYFIRQVAEALGHASSRDVVHRDIKPSNILVTPSGQAKLVDMGLARTTELDKSSHDVTASGVTLGTFDYISPEQAKDPRDADVRSDLYSLGCTWYYLLTGQPPFPEGTALQKLLKHGSERPEDPRHFRDDLSPELVAILYKMMAKKPVDRYQRAMDLISDLHLLAEYDDLPRSQSVGMVNPTPVIGQRTLVETLVPWLVSFSVLFGSIAWLQSMDSWSTEAELPRARLSASTEGSQPVDPINVEPNTNQPKEPKDLETLIPKAVANPSGLKDSSEGRVLEGKSNSPSNQAATSANTDLKSIGNSSRDRSMPNDGVSRLENAKPGASVDSSRLSADKSRVDRGDENRSPAIESMVIVWPSADLSAIVGTPWESMEMVRSLEEAIVLANRNSRIQSIQIASNSLKCGPIKIERKGLKLSAANGFQPTLIWKDDSVSEKPTSRSKELGAWFDIGENDLWVDGIQFETRDIGRGFAMFRAIGAANMTFVRCAASIENLSNDHSATFFLSESRSGLSIATDDEVLASSMPTGDPLQLTAEDCIFRGEASWFLSRTAMRSEIRCTNCMIAVQDWMLDLIGTNIPPEISWRIDLSLSSRRSLADVRWYGSWLTCSVPTASVCRASRLIVLIG